MVMRAIIITMARPNPRANPAATPNDPPPSAPMTTAAAMNMARNGRSRFMTYHARRDLKFLYI